MSLLIEPSGQGWLQVVELAVALVLSAAIGLEREIRRKSAGLRTHTIIGFSAALIMLVSKYGFSDVLGEHVVLDPSRVAAQVVSGIGFIGGGLIFVRRDAVRGLTTAAAVWLTTAVGMAAGAGLPLLALIATAGYFLVVYGLTPVAQRIGRGEPGARYVEVVYLDGQGVLRDLLHTCTRSGWSVEQLHARSLAGALGRGTVVDPTVGEPAEVGVDPAEVAVSLELRGSGDFGSLLAALVGHDGVRSVAGSHQQWAGDPEAD